MINEQIFIQLLPRALEWARATEEFILARGFPLTPDALEDAGRAGVQEPARVRVLVVDRIALPDDPELAAASQRTGIITAASRAVAIGYGIIIRADAWGDRELLVHQLVHAAQSERCGGLDSYVQQYLSDRQSCPEFTVGLLEDEARGKAREICGR